MSTADTSSKAKKKKGFSKTNRDMVIEKKGNPITDKLCIHREQRK